MPAQIDADREDDVQLAANDAVNERWAFSSKTIQRVLVAALMFWVSKQDFAQFVDQQLVVDVVSQGFAIIGTVYLGFAARSRQLAAPKGPERIYWLPRARAA